jgi:hypothetical protein
LNFENLDLYLINELQFYKMALADDVQYFIEDFKTKLGGGGVVFWGDRGKNAQALLELEITPGYRAKVLSELKVADYFAGPITVALNGGADTWVFGKNIKDRDIYIKITLGMANMQVICISFHVAEQPMKYPLK